MRFCRDERSGWRDEELSRRHRTWGFNCPAVDLDFVLCEYNHAKARALVEYKHKDAQPINPSHATYRALVDLADNYSPGPLPCFVAIYDPSNWSVWVVPLNERAQRHYAHCAGEWLSEQRFVRSLHLLRKAALIAEDEVVVAQLHSTITNSPPPICVVEQSRFDADPALVFNPPQRTATK